MKRLLSPLIAALLTASPALAGPSVLISMNNNNMFQNVLSQSAQKKLAALGAESSLDFSNGDRNKQIETIATAIRNKVSAVIVTSPNDEVTSKADALTAAAGIPLVYMNVRPGIDHITSTASIVSSNDFVAGRMQMRYLAKLIGGSGEIGLIIGEPKHSAALGRTAGLREVVARLSKVSISAEGSADWSRDKARALVAGWLKQGKTFKAIAANNDEMAIGAAEALVAAGVPKGTVLIAGVDATKQALDAMTDGALTFTILHNAKVQGERSAENVFAMLAGKPVQVYDWVPFELVTKANMAAYR